MILDLIESNSGINSNPPPPKKTPKNKPKTKPKTKLYLTKSKHTKQKQNESISVFMCFFSEFYLEICWVSTIFVNQIKSSRI